MSSKNKKYIITAGPTREWIDPVRFISNPSTGKMGIACAREAYRQGFETVLIHGPIDDLLLSDIPFTTVRVETTADMLQAVCNEICSHAVLIMAAAPADYRSEIVSSVKIKKYSEHITIDFIKNPDILEAVSHMRESDPLLVDLFLVGFAAETNNVLAYAQEKMTRKNIDMICANDVSESGAGFACDTNRIVVCARNGECTDIPLSLKENVAHEIIEIIKTYSCRNTGN